LNCLFATQRPLWETLLRKKYAKTKQFFFSQASSTAAAALREFSQASSTRATALRVFPQASNTFATALRRFFVF
jgi:hypothetical protein